jgi:hypothetical protein
VTGFGYLAHERGLALGNPAQNEERGMGAVFGQ